MSRKKLSVKSEDTKKVSLSKKLQSKGKKSELETLFNLNNPIFTSDNIVTDNCFIALIVPDSDKFILESKTEANVMVDILEINENDLQIEFNRDKQLEPDLIDDFYLFESIGNITQNQYNWFKRTYPLCAFYQITKWFGKEVNTLVIVLVEELGKPVGILKTIE